MRFSIQKIATVVCFIVAATSFVDWAYASEDDGDGTGEPGEPVEKLCISHAGESSTAPAVCTFTVVKGTGTGAGGNGCAVGSYLVTASSCSSQVVTYPDDACDGPNGKCDPPKVNPAKLKTATQAATPSVKAGDCIGAIGDGSCDCKADGAETYAFGRKTC